MAIALDTTSTSSLTSTATSSTWSHTCTGSDLVLIVIAVDGIDSAAHTSCTYNGVSMTKATETSDFSGAKASIWYLVNPATGANNIVFSGGSAVWQLGAISYTGVDTADISDGVCNTGTSSGTAVSCDITTTRNNSLIVGGGGTFDTGTLAVANGLTERYSAAFGFKRNKGGDELKVSAGAETTGMTNDTANRLVYCAMALKEKISFIPKVMIY